MGSVIWSKRLAMKAIINSKYVIENVNNFTLTSQNVFLQFKSEESKNKAIKQLSSLKIDNYGLTDLQLDANSGLTSISLFED